jgi:hypothetical protein
MDGQSATSGRWVFARIRVIQIGPLDGTLALPGPAEPAVSRGQPECPPWLQCGGVIGKVPQEDSLRLDTSNADWMPYLIWRR